jgi:hypothetical protein
MRHASLHRAGRLGTGFAGASVNRLGTASGAPLVSARPLTQQGLAGVKTGSHTGRQIQDGQYFHTKLSEKIAQVAEANESLRRELATIEKSRSRQEQLQSRFEELKDEVITAEVHLRDYNLILQKAAMQATATDVEDTLRTVNVRILPLLATQVFMIVSVVLYSCNCMVHLGMLTGGSCTTELSATVCHKFTPQLRKQE